MAYKKWAAPIFPYLAVWAGLFFFKSAWAALLGFHLAIGVTLLLLRSVIPIDALFKSSSAKWILFNVLFCSTSGIGLYYLWDVFGVAKDLPAQLVSMGLKSNSWIPFIAYFSLVNPFVEEYFWRGVLGNATRKLHFGDAVFAGYHVMILWERVRPLSMLFAVIILISAGWLWRQISRDDHGLLAAVLGHMAADFSILLVIYTMTR